MLKNKIINRSVNSIWFTPNLIHLCEGLKNDSNPTRAKAFISHDLHTASRNSHMPTLPSNPNSQYSQTHLIEFCIFFFNRKNNKKYLNGLFGDKEKKAKRKKKEKEKERKEEQRKWAKYHQEQPWRCNSNNRTIRRRRRRRVALLS